MQGVIAIMTNSQGDVIATCADFERQAPGGFKLWEGQRHRVRQQVILATVRAYCSDVIVKSVETYLAEQIGEALCRKGGHKITYRALGYPDDVAAEVARR